MKSSKIWILALVFGSLIFCASFVYFYTKLQAKNSLPSTDIENKIEKPLPKSKLHTSDSEIFADEELRKGKVILVFLSPTCNACSAEVEFLRDVVGKRSDIKFYGVATFSKRKDNLELVQEEYPFKVLFDEKMLLTLGLGIRGVPVKIYLEDGVIKRAWRGATIDDTKQKEFISWIENI